MTKSETGNAEEIAMPYVRVLSKYRDQIKKLAISNPTTSISKEQLVLSDNVRDEGLIPLGVSLEDRNSAHGEPALVKFVPASKLIAV
jgi:cysteinyl-tRNA synthetase